MNKCDTCSHQNVCVLEEMSAPSEIEELHQNGCEYYETKQDKEEKMTGWISTKERVPSDENDVLMKYPLGNLAIGYCRRGASSLWEASCGNEEYVECEEPAYWMPLNQDSVKVKDKDLKERVLELELQVDELCRMIMQYNKDN